MGKEREIVDEENTLRGKLFHFLREGKDEHEKRGNIWSVAEKGGKKGKEKKLFM